VAGRPVIEALAHTMRFRDRPTHDHAERVQDYALALAREAGVVDDASLEAIAAAAVLHDVGKLGVPDWILQKPGPLTVDEYAVVKKHVTIGADLLAAVSPAGMLAAFVRHHHESWDGSGYPDGLTGDAIPIGARIVAIVDCYDALTSDRPYRRALSHNSALAMIHERRGGMYDPQLVDAFLRLIWQRRSAVSNVGFCQYRPEPRPRQEAVR
jgi:HD-GYP domain-containing protein (c-di-GMP phosphodiesterase class II)